MSLKRTASVCTFEALTRNITPVRWSCIGVEIERDAIGIGIPVARRETTADLCGVAVEETHADVERAVVVEHADFRALGRRLAFVRIDLREVGHDLRLRPDLVVELSVDRWRACRAGGAKLAGGGLTLRLRPDSPRRVRRRVTSGRAATVPGARTASLDLAGMRAPLRKLDA